MPTSRTHIADVPVAELARLFGTPTFVYDAAMIRRRIADLSAFDVIRYAEKACSNLAVLDLVRRAGGLVDTVSAGEILRALAAGFSPEAEKGTGTFCRNGPTNLRSVPGASHKRCLSPFPRRRGIPSTCRFSGNK